MIYDPTTERLHKLHVTLANRPALLTFLRRLREDVQAIRQQGLQPFDNSALQKDIEEYHAFSLIYSRLARRNMLAFPLQISKSESPDFIIEEASERYGLEATKATPEAYQRWMKLSPTDDEAFLLHRLPDLAEAEAVTERRAARLVQAAILRKAALLPLYVRNAGTARQRLIVRILIQNIAEAEALLKVLWREGMIEGAAGFEKVIVAASSSDFILLDPETGGMRRL